MSEKTFALLGWLPSEEKSAIFAVIVRTPPHELEKRTINWSRLVSRFGWPEGCQ
jgi:hypothetical protein